MHLEEFAEGTTVLHHLDPRVKFLCGLPLMGVAAMVHTPEAAFVSLLVGIGMAIYARLDPAKLAVRLGAVNIFIMMLWVFVPFGLGGSVVFEFGPYEVTEEGLLAALVLTLKSNALVLVGIALFGTSEAFRLAHALVHLRVPGKLVHLFFFFYRYISVLHEEYTRLRSAMAVRGFRAQTSGHTYRSLGHLIGMLLVRSHERSTRIYRAMLCRAFHGHFPIAHHFHLHGYDLGAGAGLLAGTLLIAGLEYMK